MDELGLISGSHTSSRFSLDELRRSLFEEPFQPSVPPTPAHEDQDDDLSPPSPPQLCSIPDPERLPTVACQPSIPPGPTKPQATRSPSATRDDLSLRSDPSRHIDYLSQDWQEDDISSSWRHITVNRKEYGQVSRLENASWRAWAKSRFQLATVSPETLNWFKERDITWLYGPLQKSTGFSTPGAPGPSGGPSTADASSGRGHRRSILKKMDMLEVMTRRSTFSLSVLMQAAGSIPTQKSATTDDSDDTKPQKPGHLARSSSTTDLPGIIFPSASKNGSSTATSSSSSSFTKDHLLHPRPKEEKRHIRFNEVVEQRITLHRRDQAHHQHRKAIRSSLLAAAAAAPPHHEQRPSDDADDDADDDDGLEMKVATKRRRRRNTPQHAVSLDPGSGDGSSGGGVQKLETLRKLPDGALNSVGRGRERR
ncbi:protein phosphatase regulator [Diplodia seriata]|uniref:Protein phosphatase regulator n=1 Tax=Diplodia seriata TaxID=420778 RepID=A0A1S8BCU3_9PEZI|nr:hypothetical protein BK809_0000250 [Diplodia seriata]